MGRKVGRKAKVKKMIAIGSTPAKKRQSKKHRDKSRKKRHRSEPSDCSSSSSSSSGEDGSGTKRSVITGKKIRMHIEKTADDLVREKARKDLLQFMNQSL